MSSHNSFNNANKWFLESRLIYSKSFSSKFKRLISLSHNHSVKYFIQYFFDQSFRSHCSKRSIQQINYILRFFSPTKLLSFLEVALYYLFSVFNRIFPKPCFFLLKKIIFWISSDFLINDSTSSLTLFVKKKSAEKVGSTINLVGDIAIGNLHAKKQLHSYINLLKNPDIKAITVKLSNLLYFSSSTQLINAENDVVNVLRQLFSQAKNTLVPYPNGKYASKLIIIDMEGYDFLHLSINSFKKALLDTSFTNIYAGIVIQAYIPESFDLVCDLIQFSQKNCAEHHMQPIRLRIVKGANLSLETITADLNQWISPIYSSKNVVDANFKKILHFCLTPEHLQTAHIVIATHNLLELSYVYDLIKDRNITQGISFEFLEGLFPPIQTIFKSLGFEVSTYVPVTKTHEFHHCLSYLFRRLDEQTGPQHFLNVFFNSNAHTKEWQQLQKNFTQSLELMPSLTHTPLFRQNQANPLLTTRNTLQTFHNEPTTNWALKTNQAWAKSIVKELQQIHDRSTPQQYHYQTLFPSMQVEVAPSLVYAQSTPIASCDTLLPPSISLLLDRVHSKQSQWQLVDFKERVAILKRASKLLRKYRRDFILLLATTISKPIDQADHEINEAIDFIDYYCFSFSQLLKTINATTTPKGTGLVISPWNFPLALSCGGIAASLITGNHVIFKPSVKTLPIAYKLIDVFLEAGLPEDALTFIPCADGPHLEDITRHHCLDYIIFTGSTKTAKHIQQQASTIPIYAETGGKNTIIVTDMADREQAIQNIIHSAYEFGGQKCSAASLLILEESLFNDPTFKSQLIDAVTSVKVGPTSDLSTMYSDSMLPITKTLSKILDHCKTSSSVEFHSKQRLTTSKTCQPILLWGIDPQHFAYKEELFLPILSVMSAKNLKTAISYANNTGYGLTAGLESLDPREQCFWKTHIEAGNLYINKPITGAIVQRQPFGGFKHSSIGPCIKTGGPNYVTLLCDFSDKSTIKRHKIPQSSELRPVLRHIKKQLLLHPQQKELLWKPLFKSLKSYIFYLHTYFHTSHHTQRLQGEYNELRFLPVGTVLIRLGKSDTILSAMQLLFAAFLSGNTVIFSLPKEVYSSYITFFNNSFIRSYIGKGNLQVEESIHWIQSSSHIQLVRISSPDHLSSTERRLISTLGLNLVQSPPLSAGRLELLHYFKEQTISTRAHRHGSLLPPLCR